MRKIIRRTVGTKKEIGAALIVALQMITLTLIGLMAPLAHWTAPISQALRATRK